MGRTYIPYPFQMPTRDVLKLLQQWFKNRRIQQITLANARHRAARGAAYLDETDPGWPARLDPEALALHHGRSCVLGQLHGDFRQGLGRAAILPVSSAPRAGLSPVSLGFLAVQDVPPEWQARDYAWLDQAWREEVIRRRPTLPDAGHPSKTTPASVLAVG